MRSVMSVDVQNLFLGSCFSHNILDLHCLLLSHLAGCQANLEGSNALFLFFCWNLNALSDNKNSDNNINNNTNN